MDNWNKLTNILLEKNHIKLPIKKRFFLYFVDDDENNINKNKILEIIDQLGFLKDDPRLIEFRNKIKILVKTNSINYQEFSHCIDNHIYILKKIFTRNIIIPEFNKFKKYIDDIYEDTKSNNSGNVANYIPQLAKKDPNNYAISICTIDGQRYNKGDFKEKFCIQSCCKPINYGIALEELGEDKVHTYVGREPSGQSFNEITLSKKGLPHNPLINSGAIMTSSLIGKGKNQSEKFEHIMSYWNKLSGNFNNVGFNNGVYLSEKNTADRNFALAYFMNEINENKKTGFPENTNINETLELYFQCCSIEMNSETMAVVAGTLANGGINPLTGEIVFKPDTVKNMLSMMLMCGMYDYSGEFAFKIGLPAKSGVGGAIMLIIPNVMGIISWSPKLDEIGNSFRGIEFCKKFGNKFNFHIFDSVNNNVKIDPTLNLYNNLNTTILLEIFNACKNGDLEHIKILFQRNEDFNITDYDNRTPLHISVCEKKIDIIKYLINIIKVKQNVKDRWNNTPKDEANGDQDILKLFTI